MVADEPTTTARHATFDTLIATVPIAVVTFQFDPYAHLFGDLTIRWGAIALAGVIVAALLLAGLLARADGLRMDDVAFVAVGIVPGAVVGGRLGYLIVHAGYYGATPERLLDPSIGSLELGLAVVGGILTGSYVASLLGASVGRWQHLAALPVLLALGAGKLTMVLTGSGQGQPSDGDLATKYLGPGPWGSLVPGLPSLPSQAIEGIATLVVLAGLTLVLMAGTFRKHDGRFFFAAIGLWAIARMVVSTTWRDPRVIGTMNAAGLMALTIAIGCGLALVFLAVRQAGNPVDPSSSAERTPALGPPPALDPRPVADTGRPDPGIRPRS